MIVIQSLLLTGGLAGLSTILWYDMRWMGENLCPSFINFDCDPKSASYWRSCRFLNSLMAFSAVNEERLLCVSTMIIIKLLLTGGGYLIISTIWSSEWVKASVSINHDSDGKSASYWRPCKLLNLCCDLLWMSGGSCIPSTMIVMKLCFSLEALRASQLFDAVLCRGVYNSKSSISFRSPSSGRRISFRDFCIL